MTLPEFLLVCCCTQCFLACFLPVSMYVMCPCPSVSQVSCLHAGFRMVDVVTCVSLLQMAQSTAAAEESGYCSMTTDVCVSVAVVAIGPCFLRLSGTLSIPECTWKSWNYERFTSVCLAFTFLMRCSCRPAGRALGWQHKGYIYSCIFTVWTIRRNFSICSMHLDQAWWMMNRATKFV